MMGSAAAHEGRSEETPGAKGAETVRVVLVGRTGLDGRLRLDPDVELVRVRTPLEAVGELADPTMGGGRPGRCVVIIAPDADPAIRRAADGSVHEDHARTGEFLAALRHIDPQVRVLRLETSDGEAPARAGYDGVVRADSPADALRAEVRGVGAARAADQPEVRVHATPAESLPGLGRKSAGWTDIGDESLVRLLMQGRDITESAVELIRRRFPGRNVRFVPAELEGVSPPSDQPVHQASVGWRGRAMGVLRSPDVPAEMLAPQAAWLASWLALRDQHAQLREAAFMDPLSGAHNRRYFDQFLSVAIEQARKQRLPLTVLVFDIDNFKSFNDQYGHGAGDEILKETVKLLRSVIRPSDKVCRIGGDEFAVIFHEPTGPRTQTSRPPTNIFPIAQRFQKAILDHKFPKLGREAPATLTISGGLATYPWDGADAASLLARADELALQSKKAGKNCITLGPGAERMNGEGGGGA
ncbi:MAG: GGDEF domain-containing protein [Phycisphaeraceae bacterium]|nr:GGDEF domain-containing protein [Phycisphaeraceae bacterium]